MRLDCVGFGALNVDKLYRVELLAGPGEEGAVEDYEKQLGGSAANTIVGLSRLGYSAGYVGKVANDEDGTLHLKSLADEGVDTRGIVRSRQGRSGAVIGFVDHRGERTLYVDPGVNDTLDFEEIDSSYVAEARFVHITSFVGDRPFKAQKRFLEVATSRVSFDPGTLYARRGLENIRPLLRRSEVIFPNENELRILTGRRPEEGARALLREGVAMVAVKLGERGCYVTNGGESYYVPAFEAKVVDSTGAGDAFCAGFLHGLFRGRDMFECARLGNKVAAQKLARPGARAGLPHLRDIED